MCTVTRLSQCINRRRAQDRHRLQCIEWLLLCRLMSGTSLGLPVPIMQVSKRETGRDWPAWIQPVTLRSSYRLFSSTLTLTSETACCYCIYSLIRIVLYLSMFSCIYVFLYLLGCGNRSVCSMEWLEWYRRSWMYWWTLSNFLCF